MNEDENDKDEANMYIIRYPMSSTTPTRIFFNIHVHIHVA